MVKTSKQQKPFLLYTILTILILGLIFISVLFSFSIREVNALRLQNNELQSTIDDLSTKNSELQKQLDEQLVKFQDEIETLKQIIDELTAKLEALSPSEKAVSEEDALEMELLMEQLEVQFPVSNGSWAVSVTNLANGANSSMNSHPMQAASLIKLYIMGAIYENYDTLSQLYGSENLDSLLYPMITVSDNDAANTLVSYLGHGDSAAGMQTVNAYCHAHGYHDTSMGRLLLQSNDFGDNYTSVKDCCDFLTQIYKNVSDPSAFPHADSMYELLKAQTRQHKIPANLPEGVHAANKTGELADVENDAAILYHTDQGTDLVICFMSEFLSAPGDAQAVIANLSRTIYDYYNPS